MASLVSPMRIVGEMGRAEALAGTDDGGEHLLGVDGGVVADDAALAEVAVAARAGLLAEISEERLAPAERRLAEIDHRRQPPLLDHPLLGGELLLGELAPAERHVVDAVEGEGCRRQAVAPGAADLLVVRLDARRHVGVDDEAHVGLVDAHAEGDGRDHHHTVLAEEDILVVAAHRLVEAGMVGQRAMALRRAKCSASRSALSRDGACRRCRFRLYAQRGNRRSAGAAGPWRRSAGRGSAGRSCGRWFAAVFGNSSAMMSRRVAASAVAVSAITCTPPSVCRRPASARYSGRKS